MHEWPKLHIAARRATNRVERNRLYQTAKRAINNDAEKAAAEAAAKASEKLPLRENFEA